jgi:hypothetical protein
MLLRNKESSTSPGYISKSSAQHWIMLITSSHIAAPDGKNKKGRSGKPERPLKFNPGGDLRSRAVSSAVSSALQGLTSVFGMGTGVTLAVRPPGKSGSWRLEVKGWKTNLTASPSFAMTRIETRKTKREIRKCNSERRISDPNFDEQLKEASDFKPQIPLESSMLRKSWLSKRRAALRGPYKADLSG